MEGFKQLRNQFGPVKRGLRAAGEVVKAAPGLVDAFDPEGGQGIVLRLTDECGKEGFEGPVRLFETVAADGAHVGLEGGGFLGAGGGVAGGEEPVDFVLGERAGEPAEQQVGGAREGDLAERDSKGELEERGTGEGGVAEKGAFDLAAAAGCVLGHDEDAGAGVGGKLGLAPEGAGGQFGLAVRDLVEVDMSG